MLERRSGTPQFMLERGQELIRLCWKGVRNSSVYVGKGSGTHQFVLERGQELICWKEIRNSSVCVGKGSGTHQFVLKGVRNSSVYVERGQEKEAGKRGRMNWKGRKLRHNPLQ